MLHRFALGSLLLSGCGSSEPEDSEGDSQDSETVDSPVDTGPQLPADPRPLTVETTGGWAQTIVFDTPSCLHYPEAAPVTFRQFWRGSDHNAVLIIELVDLVLSRWIDLEDDLSVPGVVYQLGPSLDIAVVRKGRLFAGPALHEHLEAQLLAELLNRSWGGRDPPLPRGSLPRNPDLHTSPLPAPGGAGGEGYRMNSAFTAKSQSDSTPAGGC